MFPACVLSPECWLHPMTAKLLPSRNRIFNKGDKSNVTLSCCSRGSSSRQHVAVKSSSNGTAGGHQQQSDMNDPISAMLWAAKQDGVQVVFDNEEEAEDLEDVLDDLEDPWMRNPSPPEWAEAPGFQATPSQATSSSSSSEAVLPSSRVETVDWQELMQRILQQQQQQQEEEEGPAPCLVLLEVLPPADQNNRQELQQQQQRQPLRRLPDPSHWVASLEHQQEQQQQQLNPKQLQQVTIRLEDLTRDMVASWQQQGSFVAVWDSGHHSCLAAAIRLHIVYRLSNVVLLKQE